MKKKTKCVHNNYKNLDEISYPKIIEKKKKTVSNFLPKSCKKLEKSCKKLQNLAHNFCRKNHLKIKK